MSDVEEDYYTCREERDAHHFRLAQNDPDLARARADPSSCESLARALRGNTHVRTLTVDWVVYADDDRPESWKTLCSVVRDLESLELVKFNCYRHLVTKEDLLPITLLIQETRHKVKGLVLNMDGGLENLAMSCLARALIEHPTLETFKLYNFENTGDDSLSLLLVALSSTRNLKYLELSPQLVDYFPNVGFTEEHVIPMADAYFLKQIFRKESVQTIRLGFFRLEMEHSEMIAEALESSNSKLKELVLSHCVVFSIRSVVRAAAANSVLERLTLDVFFPDHEPADARFLAPFSTNRTLKQLELALRCQREWPRYDFLEENTALEELHVLSIGENFFPRETLVSIRDSIRQNTSLKTLQFLDFSNREEEDSESVDSLVGPMVEIIGDSNSRLKRVVFQPSWLSSARLFDFVPALAQHHTLDFLDIQPSLAITEGAVLPEGMKYDDAEVAEFVARVTTETCLKELLIGPCGSRHLKPLVEVVAKNYRLERLEFHQSEETHSDATDALQGTISAITRLNVAGRRYLIEDGRGPSSKVAGVNVLSKVSDSLDSLFYHLRENPGLCEREEAVVGELQSAPSSSSTRKGRHHSISLPDPKKRCLTVDGE